jgi:hypothetical protein
MFKKCNPSSIFIYFLTEDHTLLKLKLLELKAKVSMALKMYDYAYFTHTNDNIPWDMNKL